MMKAPPDRSAPLFVICLALKMNVELVRPLAQRLASEGCSFL